MRGQKTKGGGTKKGEGEMTQKEMIKPAKENSQAAEGTTEK